MITRCTVDKETGTHVTVRFLVTDTGVGISPEPMDRLFKTFSQVGASTTRTYGGNGLGLAICNQLVELMGGRTGFESERGRESTFCFAVPLEKQRDAVVCARSAEHTTVKRHAIATTSTNAACTLLAEDNEIGQEVAMLTLARARYDCDIVMNEGQAVDAVRIQDDDLVLMDRRMPHMDGIDVTRRIRQNEKEDATVGRKATRIPIVALTANALKGDDERCCEAGMDDYLARPLNADRQISIVRSHLSRVEKSSADLPHTAPGIEP